MSKSTKKAVDQAEREKVHKRYSNRREPDVIYPARKQVDFYDADVHQRVAVYVRVSTDNLGQETSYELQKNYYEEFVLKHPNWSLVKIYADKGISGTSTKHRVALNQMLTDSRAGKIDLIITKSVSRLARNTVDCITMVRNLAELRNPVGVFFESECIFSLNEDTSMPLSFLASIAENESRIRSRSMEVSLAQRLNGGLPLTPKLLGYSHDTDGKLVINPDEAPTVKLIFYMYLSGYSSAYIAKTLEELGKTTFLGNTKWTSNTVIQILRNERHCGDVLTRKTWTPDVISHKSKKNRGERQQSLYRGEHEAIVSRDDYIAVQHMKHVRPLKPYEIFMANIEAGNEQQLVIKRLVESYSLSIGPTKAYGVICAVATLERIYTKYGYHVLDRTLRLCVGTWEGDIDSLGGNILAGVAKMVVAFGDQLRDETFKEKVGFMSVRQLSRIAKERGAGSLGYAEAMLVAYNRKCRYTLRMTKLHSGAITAEDDFIEENEDSLADAPVLEK